jgi:hypothetical protein
LSSMAVAWLSLGARGDANLEQTAGPVMGGAGGYKNKNLGCTTTKFVVVLFFFFFFFSSYDSSQSVPTSWFVLFDLSPGPTVRGLDYPE